MSKDYSKNTQYAKLEFFQNFGSRVKYYQSEINDNVYKSLDKKIYKIIDKVEKKFKKSVFFQNYNIYYLIRIEMYEVLLQDFLFLKFYHESLKKYDQILIYISNDFSIDNQFIFQMK